VDVEIQCITVHSTKGQKIFRDDVTAESNDLHKIKLKHWKPQKGSTNRNKIFNDHRTARTNMKHLLITTIFISHITRAQALMAMQ